MIFQNPVLRGMYPDPSVCNANGKYYMVCSTFHLFPGVPVFESTDMINWVQIGHCLTRVSQLDLENEGSSGGIYAPTIRFYQNRFYMVTTHISKTGNFYVYTDDIYGEWSEPIAVDQDGIDPSLYFEDGHSYFMSNGHDLDGQACIQMCEIEIETGKKIGSTKFLWSGTGGRYLEAPHLYKFGDWYYLLESEGGTEYGHMVNYARSKSMWGPFEAYPNNPVLTNRNLGGYMLQGAGHGDIILDDNGNWWFIHLAFRQIDRWQNFHHLGRETCLQPMKWLDNGWFEIGEKGTALLDINLPDDIKFLPQNLSYVKTFESMSWDKEWCYLRNPDIQNYEHGCDFLRLRGTKISLFDVASPTFIGIRQDEFDLDISCNIDSTEQEAGMTIYMDEHHHYDVFVRKGNEGGQVVLKASIGSVVKEITTLSMNEKDIQLRIISDAYHYRFYCRVNDEQILLGQLETRYVSTEVAHGFTGVLIGLYAVNEEDNHQWTTFTKLQVSHK